MKEELNIAAILKEKPLDTKLWTEMFGEVTLDYVSKNGNGFNVKHHKGILDKFLPNGKLYEEGTLCIYPSRNMRDWSKFAWKKGDVLVCKSDSPHTYTIFDHFTNNEYTEFYGKFHYSHEYHEDYGNTNGKTAIYEKIPEERVEFFIKVLEGIMGGKLNLSTLEIEKQPEFKDGDIVVLDEVKDECFAKCILILRNVQENKIEYHAFMNLFGNFLQLDKYCIDGRVPRPATDSEKQLLFDALAKENKKWNPDTKQIEDLPKECEFKAFDFVLVSDKGKDFLWFMYQFAFEFNKEGYKYYCMIGGRILEVNRYNILPYNDQTKHLLGTTDEWKGGEG